MKRLIWAEIISIIIVMIVYAIVIHVCRDNLSATLLSWVVSLFLIFFYLWKPITGVFLVPLIPITFVLFVNLFISAHYLITHICCILGAILVIYGFTLYVKKIANGLKIKKDALIGSVIIEAALIILGFYLIKILI